MAHPRKRNPRDSSRLPGGPRLLRMMWSNVLFLHWPIETAALRPLVPAPLGLDTLEGRAWVGVVAFRMSGVRPLLAPAVPGLSSFFELAVRTYVLHEDEPGVYYFSLDASSPAAVWLARTFFHLPYFRARMQSGRRGDSVRFVSRRTHQGAASADFECVWAAREPLVRGRLGDLPRFVTEREVVFTTHRDDVFGSRVACDAWSLRAVKIGQLRSSMLEAVGMNTPAGEPVAFHADAQAMEVCPLRQLSTSAEASVLMDPALAPPPASFSR